MQLYINNLYPHSYTMLTIVLPVKPPPWFVSEDRYAIIAHFSFVFHTYVHIIILSMPRYTRAYQTPAHRRWLAW